METTTFDPIKMKAIELAVCKEFECSVYDLVNVKDTFQKKVAVYIFMQLGFDKRIIGHKYQISHLYIPTVISETEFMMKVIPGFNDKINRILNSLTYEKNMDHNRNGRFIQAIS